MPAPLVAPPEGNILSNASAFRFSSGESVELLGSGLTSDIFPDAIGDTYGCREGTYVGGRWAGFGAGSSGSAPGP